MSYVSLQRALRKNVYDPLEGNDLIKFMDIHLGFYHNTGTYFPILPRPFVGNTASLISNHQGRQKQRAKIAFQRFFYPNLESFTTLIKGLFKNASTFSL